jgi:tetratricopeptide (TPR) repeat protein
MPFSGSLEGRFEQVLADFLQAEERGERPDPSELLQTNPELETPLRDFLRDRDRFDRLAPTVMHAQASQQPEPQPVCQFGSYAVLERLGQGGRGIVYRVSDPELNRPLAVKVLRPELQQESDAVRRFLEEAQIMGQLQHPGIVPIHASGQLPDGRPYFAMKLVQGRTLAQLLAERPAPAHDLPHFLVSFQQVCQAMAYAHSRRVIHRDLKPANIMVGAFGEVQVMDWGLAKVLPANVAGQELARGEPEAPGPGGPDTVRTVRTEATGVSTVDGSVVGTFAYMAPEAASGRIEELDPRADVFGLGAVLCEILTGCPPYTGVPAWELHLKAAAGDLADAFARLDRCGADAELIALARDCLARQRECRPPDGAAVAARLTTYLADVQERLRRAEVEKAAAQARTEEARATVRAERWARRLTVGLGGALLAMVTSLTVGALWLQRQQEEEARQAEALRRDVGALLAQAIHFRQGAHFAEARKLLQQAKQRLGADGPADLREQVDQTLADTALARRLDAARQRALTLVTEGKLDYAGTEKEYAAALREAGLGQEGEDPGVVAGRVRASGVRAEVVAALDDWASIARNEPRREWLLAVARAADPHPQRDLLRQPKLWRDAAALARLAEEARVADLSPQLVVALSRALVVSGGDSLPLLRKAQARHPGDFGLNFALGWLLGNAKQWDKAVGYFRVALALRPDAVVHNNLGVALLEQGQLDEAVGHLEEAIRIDPTFAMAYHSLGNALQAQRRFDEAIGRYEQVIRLEPKLAQAHNNLGAVLTRQGRWDEAIGHYREALRLDPRYALAHSNLGQALVHNRRLDAAIRHCKQALWLDPECAPAHFNLGNALVQLRQFDAAIDHYQQALRLNPKDIQAHYNLGVTLARQGKLDAAIGHYEQALRLEPKFAEAHTNLGNALARQGKLDAAIGHYEQAVHFNPRYAQAHYNLANALRDKRWLDEAIGHYEEALRLDPKNSNAENNLGGILYEKGWPDEAIGHYQQALRLNPKNAAAHNNLGLALFVQGRFADGIGHFKEILRIDHKYAQAHGTLGEGLLALGCFVEARETTRQCLQLLPQRHPQRAYATRQLQRCERMLALQSRLPAIRSGEEKPASAAEGLDFAWICQATKHHAVAVRLYAASFAADPKLAHDIQSAPRYQAACCAALAAATLTPKDKEQPQLRWQALDWLRADLEFWKKQVETGDAKVRALAQRQLWGRQHNPALATVRDKQALAMLPDPERQAWEKLWADVKALSERARETNSK